jgi:shikimate dehydrogenase
VARVLLIGQGIGYSASPRMQAAAFAALGTDHTYEIADVDADALPATVDGLRHPGCLGANVTVPHKTAVRLLVDEIDVGGQAAGAVNTIVNRGGRLWATNTDVPAIAEQVALLRSSPRSAVVLGAGGAARAVGLALDQLSVGHVSYVARTPSVGVEPWSSLPELLADADLLVNATPVGTGSDETPVQAELLHPTLAVLDLVYRPSPTRLVREARAAGAPARGGAGVLLDQGWRSLSAWMDMPISSAVIDRMADALRAELGDGADV